MNRKSFLTALLAISLGTVFLFGGGNISDGIRHGLSLCSYTVIPSLFPLMALSVFICSSSAADFFSVILQPFTKLFHIPKNCGGILLSALIGGYPAAAKCINDSVMSNRLDKNTAEKMLCYCVNAGPPFLILTVGYSVFGNAKTGILMFSAQFISSVLIAVFLSFTMKAKSESAGMNEHRMSTAPCIVYSVTSAAESCFRMCAFIVLICGIVDFSKDILYPVFSGNAIASSIFTGLFEVTAGCISCSEIGGISGIILAGAIASFSGISVILQVAAVTDESKISLFPFLISRPIHAALTAAILRIMLLFSKDAVSAFSVKGSNIEAVFSASVPAAVSLLCMAALFLLSLVPPKTENEGVLDKIKQKFAELNCGKNR